MSEGTVRFKVGEVYTIIAHGYLGWNTYELEVTHLTKHFVDFAYERGSIDYDTMQPIRNGMRAKKYVSDFDDAEYAVLTFDFRRRGQEHNHRGKKGIAPTIMSGNFDPQPQLPISED